MEKLIKDIKKFDTKGFCKDLAELQCGIDRTDFANRLGISGEMLAELKIGRQLPSGEVLTTFCKIKGNKPQDYFVPYLTDPIASLKDENVFDEEEIEEAKKFLKCVQVDRKYKILSERD